MCKTVPSTVLHLCCVTAVLAVWRIWKYINMTSFPKELTIDYLGYP